MKTVIVPVDFSPTSANAAEFAIHLAAFYNAQLWLYNAFELPAAIGDISYPVFDMEEMQHAAEQDMETFKENLKAKTGIPINIQFRIEMNVLLDGLTQLCDELKPDLVIMGLSGKSSLTRLVVGSNTIRAVYSLKYPVLVVPPKGTFMPVRKIGFACDYNNVKENAPLDILNKIVKDFNAELHVVNVDYRNRNFTPDMLEESFILGNELKSTKPEYHNIESEDVTEGINWFAEKAKLDMIVVVPKKHDLVQRIFKRSHTRDLVFHTHTPVLCMHQ